MNHPSRTTITHRSDDVTMATCFTVAMLRSSVFLTTLHLPFLKDIAKSVILETSAISDIMSYVAGILSNFHMSALAPKEDQLHNLHFTKGYAINPNTVLATFKLIMTNSFIYSVETY